MRSVLLDQRLQPVENLALNPRFRRVVPGTTIVRRNECQDPKVETNNVWNTTTSSKGFTPAGKTALVLSRVSGSTSLATYYVARRSLVSPGDVIALSVEGIVGAGMRLSADVQFFRTDGSTAGITPRQNLISPSFETTPGQPANTVAPDGVPTRFGRTHTAPAESVRYAVRIFVDNGLDGVCYATDVLTERRPAVLPFFHPGLVDNTGIVYEWEGPANASPTIARASVVELRRNVLPTPILSSSVAGWTSATNASHEVSPSGAKVTLTGIINSGASIFFRAGFNEAVMVPGESWTATFQIRNDSAQAIGLRMSYGYGAGTSVSGSAVTIQPGAIGTVTYTGVTPEGETTARPILRAVGAIPAGTVLTVLDNPIFENTSAVTAQGPTFSGALTPDADLTPAYLGVANESPSVLYGTRVAEVSAGGGRDLYYSWTFEGLAVNGRSNANGSNGAVAFDLKIGKTYTVVGRLRIVGPLARSESRRMFVLTDLALSATAPNVPGEYWLRLTWTATANTTLRLGQSGIGEPATIWDRLMIVEGVYDGPFLDGDSPNAVWLGPRHASKSAGYPSQIAA